METNLIEPMGDERKKRMFNLLCKIGFKQIEIGFPAASQTDFDFTRYLINEKVIPSDVTIQVLTQARPEIIKRTFEALDGAPNAILHFIIRLQLFKEKLFLIKIKRVKKIATDAAKLIKELSSEYKNTNWSFEYSPESFTGTELDYAVEVCDDVVGILKDSSNNKIIINLPATVEMSTANIYGDQIEWMSEDFENRKIYVFHFIA